MELADPSDEAKHMEKLYEFGQRLNESKDKSQNLEDYQGIINAAKTSMKAKHLAAELIPRFFKFFPGLSFPVRVQAIQGLPLFCKDTPEHISKIVDILVQLLSADEFVACDAVHKALMALLRQDVKPSLTALFKHIGNVDEPSQDDVIREKVLNFIRDKVFPIKSEVLKPQEEMERHITDLIKKCLKDVTTAEFRMFMDFLRGLSIFREKAPKERMDELIGIIEGHADLDAQFNVLDADHIDRFISCLSMALPFIAGGESNSKLLNYVNKHIRLVSDQLPDEQRRALLNSLAEVVPFTTSQDSRQVQLLKVPNATNSLCGYEVVTGQPSDGLGEDFTEEYKEFTERMCTEEERTTCFVVKYRDSLIFLHDGRRTSGKYKITKHDAIKWAEVGSFVHSLRSGNLPTNAKLLAAVNKEFSIHQNQTAESAAETGLQCLSEVEATGYIKMIFMSFRANLHKISIIHAGRKDGKSPEAWLEASDVLEQGSFAFIGSGSIHARNHIESVARGGVIDSFDLNEVLKIFTMTFLRSAINDKATGGTLILELINDAKKVELKVGDTIEAYHEYYEDWEDEMQCEDRTLFVFSEFKSVEPVTCKLVQSIMRLYGEMKFSHVIGVIDSQYLFSRVEFSNRSVLDVFKQLQHQLNEDPLGRRDLRDSLSSFYSRDWLRPYYVGLSSKALLAKILGK